MFLCLNHVMVDVVRRGRNRHLALLVWSNACFSEPGAGTSTADDESDVTSVEDSGGDTTTAGPTDTDTDTDTATDTVGEMSSGSSDGTKPCGNGTIDGEEVCDDGNDAPADGCEPDCTYTPGFPLWTVIHDGPAHWNDAVSGLAVDQATGDVIVAGDTASMVQNRNAYIARFTSAGELVWTWTEDLGEGLDDRLTAIAIDHAGNIVVTGGVALPSEPNVADANIVVAKFSPMGEEAWRQHIDGAEGWDYGNGIALDRSDNIIVAATYRTLDQHLDAHILKLDANGEQLWDHEHNGPANDADFANAVVVDDDDEICWIGDQTADTVPIQGDIVLQCLRSDGVELWTKSFDGGVFYDHGFALAVAGDRIYATGSVSVVANEDNDLWIGVYESDGTLVWSRTWGEVKRDEGRAIVADVDGRMWIAGAVSASDSDVLVARWNGEDEPLWLDISPGNGDSFGYAIARGLDGAIFVGGAVAKAGQGMDAWLRKLGP